MYRSWSRGANEAPLIMLLTLDVGNSQIFGGVYDGGDLKITFRRTSSIRASSDEFGTFFRATLREKESIQRRSIWPQFAPSCPMSCTRFETASTTTSVLSTFCFSRGGQHD